MILGIDPGNEYTAYCLMTEDYEFYTFEKLLNRQMMKKLLFYLNENRVSRVVLERVASYGMPVGREVFETCEWIGRFAQEAEKFVPVEYIYRKDEKLYICGDSRAKDGNIRQALIDRFAKHDLKNGKGTKKDPDVFYGVSADMWAAAAICVTYRDMQKEGNRNGKTTDLHL